MHTIIAYNSDRNIIVARFVEEDIPCEELDEELLFNKATPSEIRFTATCRWGYPTGSSSHKNFDSVPIYYKNGKCHYLLTLNPQNFWKETKVFGNKSKCPSALSRLLRESVLETKEVESVEEWCRSQPSELLDWHSLIKFVSLDKIYN